MNHPTSTVQATTFRPKLVRIEAGLHVKESILQCFTKHHYKRIEEYLKYDNVNSYCRPTSE